MQPGSAPISDSSAAALPRAVREYKRYYYVLLIVSGLLFLCIGIYLWLWQTESNHTYSPLNPNTRLTGVMAADDSTGNFIATVARNYKDSTVSILISEDGGANFVQIKGWKTTVEDRRTIHKIYIAPDHKSIVAVDDKYIYLKEAGADSFTVIKTTEYISSPIRGAVFSHISDSVFVFAASKIYAFDYKKYDSVSVGQLLGIGEISSMEIAAETNHVAGIGKTVYSDDYGAFTNYRISFLKNPSVEPLNIPDTTHYDKPKM